MPRRACQFTGSGQIRLLVMTLYFLMVFSPAIIASQAQIAPSVTPGGDLGTKAPQSHPISVNIQGHHYDTRYDISGGTPKGENLFHSFEFFSVPESAIAIFLNSHQGQQFQNIISRVIGDGTNPITASQLLGRIDTATNFSSANFWLINPAGIVIGPNAVFNIAGTINLASANYLQLGRERFNAANESISGAVLKANPTAWGFLGATPTSGATIQLNGGQFNNGQTLTVVGRDSQAGANGIEVGGSITIPGGTVKLGSVGKLASGVTSGEMTVDSLTATGFEHLGSVRMTSGAGIDVSADTGGAIFIRANHLVMEASSNLVNRTNSGKSDGVTIDLTGDFTLDDHSYVYSPSFGTGAGGTIDVTADRVSLKNGSFFYAPTFVGTGAGGSLNLKVDKLQATDSFLYTGGFRFDFDDPNQNIPDVMGVGKAGPIAIEGKHGGVASLVDLKNTTVNSVGIGTFGGDVTITAKDVHLTNGTSIRAATKGAGTAGNIMVRAERLLEMANTTITTEAEGTGAGGGITIQSMGDMTLTETVLSANVNNVPGNSQGAPTGNILVTTPKQLSMTGGWITAQTTGSRHAGNIELKAGSLITAKGKGPDFFPHRSFEPDRVVISSSSTGRDFDKTNEIFKSPATGNAGTITIRGMDGDAMPGTISLSDTNISTGAKGTGAGGQITITASSMAMTQSTLSASVNKAGSDANGANIELTTPSLTMTGGGIIAQTAGSRNAGNITLSVGSLTTVKGSAEKMDTHPSLTNRVVISSSSTGFDANNNGSVLDKGKGDVLATGNAGSITIRGQNGVGPVPGTISLSDTDVVSRAIHTGEGGTISMKSNQAITLKDVFISTGVNNLASHAKNDPNNLPTITLITPDLRISGRDVNRRDDEKPNELNNDQLGGRILAETTGSRDAGNIILNVDQLTIDRHPVTKHGVIISSSSTGNDFQENTGTFKTPATGNAGTITIRDQDGKVPGTISLKGATMTTEALGTGKGGPITIQSLGDIALTDTVLSANVKDGINDSSGVPTSTILVTTPKQLSMTGGWITAQTTGSRNAGNIALSVGSLTTAKGSRWREPDGFQNDRVEISSSSTGFETTGNAGRVWIGGIDSTDTILTAVPGHISLNDTKITTEAKGTGVAGEIKIGSASSMALTHSLLQATVADAPSNKNGANIELTTPSLTMTGTRLMAQTHGTGNAGDITLKVDSLTTAKGSDAFKLDQSQTNRATISSSSTSRDKNETELKSRATGNAGTITIRGVSGDKVLGPISLSDTNVASRALGTGEGGTISIASKQAITLKDVFLTTVVNDLPAGALNDPAKLPTITLTTPDLRISGRDVNFRLDGNFDQSGGQILAETFGTRHAGNIIFNVGQLAIDRHPVTKNGVTISSSSTGNDFQENTGTFKTPATGNAGTITIRGVNGDKVLGPISLRGARITTEAQGTGAGGPITIRSAGDMTLTETVLSANVNGGIESSLVPTGTILVTTPKQLSITGGGITAQTTGSRHAGNITLSVGSLTTSKGNAPIEIVKGQPKTDRVVISSSSTGHDTDGDGFLNTFATGNAGQVRIDGRFDSIGTQLTDVPGVVLLGDTDISTAAEGTGLGGPITILASSPMTLTHSTLSANVHNTATSDPSGANILLTAPSMTVTGGGITAQTTGSRNAGTITLNVDALTTQAGTVVGGPLTKRVLLSSSSLGSGDAGTVTIKGSTNAGTSKPIVLNGTDITTESNATGKGGSITIEAAEDITLTDTVLSANVNKGTDIGGVSSSNIMVKTPKHLAIAGGGITAQTIGTRHAGQIDLLVGSLTTSTFQGNRVSISSSSLGPTTTGNAGQVRIGGGFDGAGTQLTAVPGIVSLGDTDTSTAAEGTGLGGPITILASSPMTLTHSTLSANVHNTATSDPSGANILLTAPSMTVTGGGITAQTTGSRNAGTITLNVDALTTQAGTKDIVVGGSTTKRVQLSSSSTGATTQGGRSDGNAGNITIAGVRAGSLPTTLILADTTIETDAQRNGGGGTIVLGTTGSTSLQMTRSIVSARVNEMSQLQGHDSLGSVRVSTGNLQMMDSSEITVKTDGSRNAGTVVASFDSLSMQQSKMSSQSTGQRVDPGGDPGAGGSIQLTGTSINLLDHSLLVASSAGSGRAGNIVLSGTGAPSPASSAGSSSSSPLVRAAALAPNEASTPSSILITGKSQVKSSSSGTGAGGDITMNVTNITITDGAEVSATNANLGGSGATGAAGAITMTAANQYLQRGGAKVTTETEGVATNKLPGAGNIQIVAGGDAFLLEHAAILANSKNGTGPNAGDNLRDAGTISLTAGHDIQMRNATIATEADAALGGSITLRSPSFFNAHASRISSSVKGTEGSDGGNISIAGQRFQLIEGTKILAQAEQGRGGDISLSASGAILVDPSSTINASSARGAQFSGRVDVQAPVKVLSGTIVPVRPFFAQAALSTDRCSADPAGKFSSFTQGKRDGLPQEPGRFAPSPLTLEQLEAPGQARDLNRPILQAKRLNVPMLTIAVDPQLALTSGMGCGGV